MSKETKVSWTSLEDFIRPKGSSRRLPTDLIYSVTRSGEEHLGMLKIGEELAEQSRLRVGDKVTLVWNNQGYARMEKTDQSNRRLKMRGRWLTLVFPVKPEMNLPMTGAVACQEVSTNDMTITCKLPESNGGEGTNSNVARMPPQTTGSNKKRKTA